MLVIVDSKITRLLISYWIPVFDVIRTYESNDKFQPSVVMQLNVTR